MTRILSGKTFSKFHILRFLPSSGYIQINTTDALTNWPGYIENMKILTTNRGNYQASLLRIQKKEPAHHVSPAHGPSPRLLLAPCSVFIFSFPIILYASRSFTIISCASRSCLLSQFVLPSQPCGVDTSLVLRLPTVSAVLYFFFKFRLWKVVPAPVVGWSFQR
jgi:hypothetical protein